MLIIWRKVKIGMTVHAELEDFMRKTIKKQLGILLSGVLLVSSILLPVSAKAAKKEVDLNGTYHAALGVSTATQKWINRNAYYDKNANDNFGTDKFDKMVSEDAATGEIVTHEGTFTDAEIKGNGTYTVKLEGANFEGETTICMLHVPTDIPVTDKIKFTDVSAKINNKTVLEFDEAYMEDEEPYLGGGMDMILLNIWREPLVKQLSESGKEKTTGNGYDYLLGTGNETIEVTFTVSGFNYDKEVEETPAPTGAAQKDDEKAGNGMAVPIVIAVVAVVAVIGVVVVVKKRKK